MPGMEKCAHTTEFVQSYRVPTFCGEALERTATGFLVFGTVVFPIEDARREYYFRVSFYGRSAAQRPLVLNSTIDKNVARRDFWFPVTSQPERGVRLSLAVDLLSTDEHFAIRSEDREVFDLAY